jgi:DNA-binding MarR family transcriptional regulator
VERRTCSDDRRGQTAVLTDAGRSAQAAAAPGHVAEVRLRLFDHLSPEQLRDLEAICNTVIAGAEQAREAR